MLVHLDHIYVKFEGQSSKSVRFQVWMRVKS